jgi:endoglucanase
MAELYKQVRVTAGANNVILLGGLAYAHQFGSTTTNIGWVSSVKQIMPTVVNVAASYHQYDKDPYVEAPANNTIQNSVIAKQYVDTVITAGYPLLIGETGAGRITDDNSNASYKLWFENFLAWADQNKLGYLGWTWNHSAAPDLLTSDVTTPGFTPYGVEYFKHLATTTY